MLRPADVNQVVDHWSPDTITCLEDALEDDCFDFYMGKDHLPFMCKIFIKQDWALLQKCISPTGPSLNIKRALKSEVVAICVFLLFIKVPPPIKKASACVLASISPGFRGTPDVSNQEEVENLVLDVLGSVGERSIVEVQRQVCLSISFLASSSNDRFLDLVIVTFFEDITDRSLELKFGPGINDRLLQLIRDPSCSSKLTFPLLSAIANTALVSQDMTEKIFKTEVSECWLGKLMDKEHDYSFLEAACLAVACIASYACREVKGDDTGLWNHFKSRFVPVIVNKCFPIQDFMLTRSGALALLWITKFAASSPGRIDDLVNGGALKAFFIMNDVISHNSILSLSVAGIITILSVGDVVGNGKRKRKRRQGPKYNKYADLIDDFELGWDFLSDPNKYWEYYCCDIAREARIEIVLKYRPRLYYGYDPEEFDIGSSSFDDDDDDDDDDDGGDESDDEENKMSVIDMES